MKLDTDMHYVYRRVCACYENVSRGDYIFIKTISIVRCHETQYISWQGSFYTIFEIPNVTEIQSILCDPILNICWVPDAGHSIQWDVTGFALAFPSSRELT